MSLRLRQTLSLLFAVLALSGLHVFAQVSDPLILPSQPRIEKRNGRIVTPGYFPYQDLQPVQPFSIPLCKQAPTKEALDALEKYKLAQSERFRNIWPGKNVLPGDGPIIKLTVNRQGELQDVRLLLASNDPSLDRQIIDNLKKQLPLAAVPAEYPGLVVDFTLSRRAVEFILQNPDIEDRYKIQQHHGQVTSRWIFDLNRKVSKNWKVHGTYRQALTAVALLTVHTQTGQVLDSEILASSCNPGYDEEVLRSIVQLKEPFQPLPQAFPVDFIKVSVNYDYDPYFYLK